MKRSIFLSTLFLIIAEGCCNHSSCRVPSELKDILVVAMVSQEYYLRVFQDVFDEIFPSRIDDLAIALLQNNRNFVTDSICEGIYCKRAREYEQYRLCNKSKA